MDKAADLKQALDITINAKCQRPGVCNAAETLLVHEAVAAEFMPAVVQGACTSARSSSTSTRGPASWWARPSSSCCEATDKHYATEFLDLEMAVKVVDEPGEAVEHIARYGTGHSEAIVTRDLEASRRFAQGVDAAVVYINASTRFTDGGVFGLGAEIGISTQKLHARGPLALKELTSTKYVVTGKGSRPLEPGAAPSAAEERGHGPRRTPSPASATRPGLRLGIMGGAFDPIHIAHLVTAEEALLQFGLDEVVFMPAGRSAPQEPRAGSGGVPLSPGRRWPRPHIPGSRSRASRSTGQGWATPSTRWSTWPAILAADAELFFITGADAVLDILTWKDPARVLELCTLIAATRPGYDLSRLSGPRWLRCGPGPSAGARGPGEDHGGTGPGHLLQHDPGAPGRG